MNGNGIGFEELSDEELDEIVVGGLAELFQRRLAAAIARASEALVAEGLLEEDGDVS